LIRATIARKTFVKSSFNLGWLGVPLAWISGLWLLITSCFFLFPSSFDENLQQTPEIFNFTCVVVGGVLLLATFYWIFWARKIFKGP
jgi:hypothetical protein